MLKEILQKYEWIVDNEFLNLYIQLCENNEHCKFCRENKDGINGYELHHIIPRMIIKDDSENNVVKLKYADHVLAHYYLSQCVDKNSIYYHGILSAFTIMIGNENDISLNELKNKLSELEEKRKEGITLHTKWLKEHKIPQEQRNKMIEGTKKFYENETEEHKQMRIKHISEGKLKQHLKYSDEIRKKLSESHKGKKVIPYKRTPETLEKLSHSVKSYFENLPEGEYSKIMKERWSNNKEGREKLSKFRKGKKWYNNGKITKQLKEDEVPDGWIKGRLPKSN